MTKLDSINIGQLATALQAVVVSDDPGAAQLIASGIFEHAGDNLPAHNAAERVYPPYELMVQRLFKTMPEILHASAMHAAIGISGEAAELLGANGRKHLLEECGDIEFYIAAFRLQVMPDYAGALVQPDERTSYMSMGNVVNNIVTTAGDILDIVKKAWVYGKPMDHATATRYILVLEINLDVIYDMAGTNREEVQHMNQVKLIGPGGRYESGFYSDEAAIARADKVVAPAPAPGADRNFIGKKA